MANVVKSAIRSVPSAGKVCDSSWGTRDSLRAVGEKIRDMGKLVSSVS